MRFGSIALKVAVLSGVCATVALIGCGSVPVTVGNATAVGDGALFALKGSVHGGQQPIGGAQIALWAAGTSGYGTGATSLLSGGSVMSGTDGSFSITNKYTCPSDTSQAYLVATGGNTGAGVNPKAVLIAALGTCKQLSSATYINMNEVTSVATVYALAQFMTPGTTEIGTSSTNTTGMLNAFATVNNLVDVASGAALATTPAGNGTVPQAYINTLANIMAACVNTTGATGACPTLMSAATPPGGTAPADTLSAMLDIAQNPGHNVSTLYNLTAALGAFQPTLAGAPNDWTLSISYTGGGLNTGQIPAVDAAGNIWVPNAFDNGFGSSLSEFSPVGAPLSPAAGYTGGGLSYPEAAAVDLTGNVWTANEGNASVSEFSSNGTPLSGSGFTMTGMFYPYDIAVDGTGNVFTANGNNTVTKFSSTGSGVSLFTGGGLAVPYAVAIDASENVWIANGQNSANSISKFNNTGTPAATQAYTGGGLNVPYSVAIDAGGNVWAGNSYYPLVSELNSAGSPLSGSGYQTPDWVASIAVDGSNTVWTANGDGSVSHFANNGTAISPSMGYISPEATGEVGIAIDASGNVWTTDATVNSLFEYVGAAGPVTVPQALAVKNGKLGQKP